MPTYCYRREDNNQLVELFLSIKEHDRLRRGDFIRLSDGALARRDFPAEAHKPIPEGAGYRRAQWPLVSEAAGVHPDQVQEAKDHSVAIGIPTEFTPDGCAVFTSRRHRKDYCQAIGMYDLDGGYGDPSPTNVSKEVAVQAKAVEYDHI